MVELFEEASLFSRSTQCYILSTSAALAKIMNYEGHNEKGHQEEARAEKCCQPQTSD